MRIITLIVLAFSLLLPGFLFAAESPAGRVIISLGSVTGIGDTGASRSLKRGDSVFSGETIKTGASSKTQLRFTDNTLVALDATTEFKVKNYRFSPESAAKVDQYMLAKNEPSSAEKTIALIQKKGDLTPRPVLQANDQMIVALAKGGLRMVTGAIVKTNPNAYQIGTVVGTIGVRGTTLGVHTNKNKTVITASEGNIFITLLNKVVLNLGPASLYTVATFSGDSHNPNISVQKDLNSPPAMLNTQTGTVSGSGTSGSNSGSGSFSSGGSATNLPSNTSPASTNQTGPAICKDCGDCPPHPC